MKEKIPIVFIYRAVRTEEIHKLYAIAQESQLEIQTTGLVNVDIRLADIIRKYLF